MAITALCWWHQAPLAAPRQETPWSQCRPAGSLHKVAGLTEASGLAASRSVPGRLWTHNDSGQPILFGIDAKGSVTARVRLAGATVDDWEAVGVGSCSSGSCVYVGDIGDNKAIRRNITIYRVPEPASAAGATVTAEALHATYPDGAHDAEALLVAPDGSLYVVTKGDAGPVTLYKFPRTLNPGATVALERVSQRRGGGKGKGADDRITDGAISADGAWVVLRTKTALIFYPARDFLAGAWRETQRIDLTALGEPQGEGVAFGGDGTVFVVGEGAGAGSLGRITCRPTPER